MIGASDRRILGRHLLPHLVPTLLVWAPIAVATNILLEVGLSFIGAGVQPSTPTWGSLLSTRVGDLLLTAALRPRPDGLADDRSRPWRSCHGPLAQPGLRRRPPSDRAVGPAMTRFLIYAARRIAAALFTLLTLIRSRSSIYWSLPSTPAAFVYPRPAADPYQLDHANKLLGLDRPKASSTCDYVWQLAHGDVGRYWEGSCPWTTRVSSSRRSARRLFKSCPEHARRSSSAARRSSCCCCVPLGALRRQPCRLARRPDDLDRRRCRRLHPSDGARR